MKIALYLIFFVLLGSFVSCGKPEVKQRKSADEFTKEELVVIEFATRMEETERKYEDFHPDEKEVRK